MKCQTTIDWLTFTVKSETDPAAVITEYLGMDPDLFQDSGSCLPGYQSAKRFSDIIVCYEPRENEHFKDMGVCVSMSGNGCRAFETMNRSNDRDTDESSAFIELIRLLNSDVDVNISRIDVACDDREGYLCMDDIVRKVQENEVNSRMTKRAVTVSFNGVKRNGSTVYIGAESSDFRVRIYDKALEQGIDGHWIRVELVMRHENANAFAAQMTDSETVGKLAAQVINDKFFFIDRDDSNITRCTVCGWWTKFVEELEAVRLVTREVVQHPVEHIRDWTKNQVHILSPPLFSLFYHIFCYWKNKIRGSLEIRSCANRQELNEGYIDRLRGCDDAPPTFFSYAVNLGHHFFICIS